VFSGLQLLGAQIHDAANLGVEKLFRAVVFGNKYVHAALLIFGLIIS
jgi:hypothetical protein